MRVDDFHVRDVRARQRLQTVDDVELHLAGDHELVLEQQIVVAMNGAADGVLERDHAVRGPFLHDSLEHSSKVLHGIVSTCCPP
jgi:hypothetical protein